MKLVSFLAEKDRLPAYMVFTPNNGSLSGTLSRGSWIILSVKENKILPKL